MSRLYACAGRLGSGQGLKKFCLHYCTVVPAVQSYLLLPQMSQNGWIMINFHHLNCHLHGLTIMLNIDINHSRHVWFSTLCQLRNTIGMCPRQTLKDKPVLTLCPQLNPYISRLLVCFPVSLFSPCLPPPLCVCVSGMAFRLLSAWRSPALNLLITSSNRTLASPLLIATLFCQ